MNSVYREINDGLREELLQALGRHRFRLWFRDTSVVDVDEHALTLAVPTDVHRTWLEFTYGDVLRDACERVLGEGVDVRLRVSAQQEARRSLREKLPQRPAEWDELLERRGLPASLDTFVAGSSGRFAVMILRQLRDGGAVRGATTFYLHGACGAGKSHLLEGLHGDVTRRRPGDAVYMTARRFTQRYVTALRAKEVDALRAFELDLSSRRLILIDDVDELAARKATQAALVRLQERCCGTDTRLVLAGRAHPAEIAGFSPSLRSRLLGGIVLGVTLPDRTRLGDILADRAMRRGTELTQDVRTAILDRTASVRGAVGILDRWAVASAEVGRPLEVDWLEELAPSVAATAREEVIRRAKEVVAQHFGISRALLDQPTKIRTAAFPRRMAMYLVYRACALPLTELGSAFGLRSHSSVSRAIHEMRDLRRTDAGVEQLVDGLLARI
ncbi:MAG: DnaA/Hda family protein [Planctomycetota bacterium]|nr:DnaA/Hda family protein [Planctomycetota bacterium]